MFRSERMTLCQMFIQREAAYESVAALGEAGIVQFRDLNKDINAYQRNYVNEVRRAEEMERILNYVLSEINKSNFHINIKQHAARPDAPNYKEIDTLEAILERTESELIEVTKNVVALKGNFTKLTETKHVLRKAQAIFEEQEEEGFTDESGAQIPDGQIGWIAGVVQRERAFAFERMLWRITRGNILARMVDLDDPLPEPVTGKEVLKSVFVVFFQGEQLRVRVNKICAGFHATTYDCPRDYKERNDMLKDVETKLEDIKMILNQSNEHLNRVLLAASRDLYSWKIMILKMKAVYHTMNFFSSHVSQGLLVGEGWVPKKDLHTVRAALRSASDKVGSTVGPVVNELHTLQEPPTFNRSNKFTRGFQNLIDSYGIASYREVNPALYTIITFPFLFGVMFGDMGHGIILLVFAVSVILREKHFMAQKSNNEIWNIFFGGRYIILLMGLFSIYCGFIYNDFFSKSLNIFGSSWKIEYDRSTIASNEMLQLDPATSSYTRYPYPVGIDPVWQLADNKINFLNAYKMKMSIIFGVIHMLFGVSMNIANHMYFKRPIFILIQFVPEFVFLVAIFFYLVVMIFMKWTLYPPYTDDILRGTTCAPPVLNLFIDMIMFQESKSRYPECDPYMYENQQTAQMILMVIAIICIPAMLILKPLYLLRCQRKKPVMKKMEDAGENDKEEHETASDIIIHQIIHTIETVLSTVSHTASYLRLWALSLAHAQLSDVLWTKVLQNAFIAQSYAGCIAVYVLFAFWAVLSIAILVLMEGLSAFLHTLRLHWVEFMSKFFTGLGYQFQAFSLKKIIDEEE